MHMSRKIVLGEEMGNGHIFLLRVARCVPIIRDNKGDTLVRLGHRRKGGVGMRRSFRP
jgi:hypothetical protein